MARPCFCAWLAVGASSLVAPARRLAPSRGAGLVARAGDPLVEGLSDTESGGPLGVFLSKSNPLYSSVPSSAAPSLIAEDAAMFDYESQTEGWVAFALAVGTILSFLAVLWILPDTGYGDDFVAWLEAHCGNSHGVTLAFGLLFPVVHSGLAALRPAAEAVVGARVWRVVFASCSLPLAYSWIVYFIAHAHDGLVLWDGRGVPALHGAAWLVNFASFFFLYPTVFNLKEVAAVERPQVHLWETGIIRITRHPQMVGQVMWSAAHLSMVGSTFTALTMALLVGHHVFAVWHGDTRLADAHGDRFEAMKARTSVVPFAAILDGRAELPRDYWKELARAPYALIAAGTLGAYLAHPYMQAGAALVQNTGLHPGGILDPLFGGAA